MSWTRARPQRKERSNREPTRVYFLCGERCRGDSHRRQYGDICQCWRSWRLQESLQKRFSKERTNARGLGAAAPGCRGGLGPSSPMPILPQPSQTFSPESVQTFTHFEGETLGETLDDKAVSPPGRAQPAAPPPRLRQPAAPPPPRHSPAWSEKEGSCPRGQGNEQGNEQGKASDGTHCRYCQEAGTLPPLTW